MLTLTLLVMLIPAVMTDVHRVSLYPVCPGCQKAAKRPKVPRLTSKSRIQPTATQINTVLIRQVNYCRLRQLWPCLPWRVMLIGCELTVI